MFVLIKNFQGSKDEITIVYQRKPAKYFTVRAIVNGYVGPETHAYCLEAVARIIRNVRAVGRADVHIMKGEYTV